MGRRFGVVVDFNKVIDTQLLSVVERMRDPSLLPLSPAVPYCAKLLISVSSHG